MSHTYSEREKAAQRIYNTLRRYIPRLTCVEPTACNPIAYTLYLDGEPSRGVAVDILGTHVSFSVDCACGTVPYSTPNAAKNLTRIDSAQVHG